MIKVIQTCGRLSQRDLSIAAMRCFVKWNWILDVPTIAPLPAASLLKSPYHQTFDDLEAALSGGLFRFKQACTSAHDVVDGCAGRPAEGRRCKSVTVKAQRATPTPSHARAVVRLQAKR